MNFFNNRSNKTSTVDDVTDGLQAIMVNNSSNNHINAFIPNLNNTNANSNMLAASSRLNYHQELANSTDKENTNILPPPSPTKSIQYTTTDEHYDYHNIRSNGVPVTASTKNQPANSNTGSSLRFSKDFIEKANSQKTKRLINVCQMYFLDYYCDMFDYVVNRRQRLNQAKHEINEIAAGDQPEQQRLYKKYLEQETTILRQRRLKPKHKDFQMITQVGQGGYGQVYLARKKDTREVVALKILSKRLLMKLDETRHVLTERDILTNTRSDWLVKLYYAFQDQESVFLAMEFVPGGDYRTLLNNTGVLIPPHARFYMSEMFMAVNALHELGYTHRDLKPENFLIDSTGHIKLTDFGLAAGSISNDRIELMRNRLKALTDLQNKSDHDSSGSNTLTTGSVKERQQMYRSLRQTKQQEVQLANSIVGSPDYMALEVLQGRPYDYTIDYWSLGCMLFETLVGYPPFAGSHPEDTYNNLRRWKEALRRPKYDDGRYVFSDRTWQLILRLIASPQERLKSFQEICNMNYFQDVDWKNLRNRIPPFTPQLDDEEDAGYFDDFNNDEDMAKYKEVMAKREAIEKMDNKGIDNRYFIGFTFKHSGSKFVAESNSSSTLANGGDHIDGDPFTTWY